MDKRYTGNHELVVNPGTQNPVYLRVSTSIKFEMDKPYSRRFNIEQVERNIALREIVKTKYFTKKVKNKEQGKIKSLSEFSTLKTRNPFSK